MKDFLKNNKLFTGLWAALSVLSVILIIGLISGWGVDKSLPGIYFNPQVEKCTDESIETLIGSYYTADVAGDEATLKALFVDPETIENIKAKTDIIESYSGFEFYGVEGLEDYSYVVYVYWEVKFPGIETKAPGMEVFYLVSEGEGISYFIKNELNQEEKDYLKELEKDEYVIKLYDDTKDKLKEALKDSKLETLYNLLVE